MKGNGDQHVPFNTRIKKLELEFFGHNGENDKDESKRRWKCRTDELLYRYQILKISV